MIKKILKIILSAGFTFGFITVSLADTVLLEWFWAPSNRQHMLLIWKKF